MSAQTTSRVPIKQWKLSGQTSRPSLMSSVQTAIPSICPTGIHCPSGTDGIDKFNMDAASFCHTSVVSSERSQVETTWMTNTSWPWRNTHCLMKKPVHSSTWTAFCYWQKTMSDGISMVNHLTRKRLLLLTMMKFLMEKRSRLLSTRWTVSWPLTLPDLWAPNKPRSWQSRSLLLVLKIRWLSRNSNQ